MSMPGRRLPDLHFRLDEHYSHLSSAFQAAERNGRDACCLARLLNLAPDTEVLVVLCGFGHIANGPLACGCRVTVLDGSPLFLPRPRQDAADLGVAVHDVEGACG